MEQQSIYYPQYFAHIPGQSGQPQMVSLPMGNQPVVFYQPIPGSPSSSKQRKRSPSPSRKNEPSKKPNLRSGKSSKEEIKHSSETTQDSKLKTDSSSKVNQKSSDKFYCDICKISCPGEAALNSHLVGKKHRSKIEHDSSSEPPKSEHYPKKPSKDFKLKYKPSRQARAPNSRSVEKEVQIPSSPRLPPLYLAGSTVGETLLNMKHAELTPNSQLTHSMVFPSHFLIM